MVKILCVWYLYRTYRFYIYKETLQKAVYDYELNYKPEVNNENSNNDSVIIKQKNLQVNKTGELVKGTVRNIDKYFKR